jgi:hypothetical protein
MNRSARLALLCAVSMATIGHPTSAKDGRDDAKDYVSVRFEGTCDIYNGHVRLKNKHGSRDIMVTVSWRVYGGSFSTQQFRSNAGMDDPIGCASDANITAARFIN